MVTRDGCPAGVSLVLLFNLHGCSPQSPLWVFLLTFSCSSWSSFSSCWMQLEWSSAHSPLSLDSSPYLSWSALHVHPSDLSQLFSTSRLLLPCSLVLKVSILWGSSCLLVTSCWPSSPPSTFPPGEQRLRLTPGPPLLVMSECQSVQTQLERHWEVMTGILTGLSRHTIQNIQHQIQNNKMSGTVLELFTVCHFNDFEHSGWWWQ